jgi:hypothetical protein
VIGRRRLELVDAKGDPAWEFSLFRGLDDWRLGVYVERHPHEVQVSLHVPCLSLVIFRYR